MTEYFALPPILGFAGLAVAFIIYHIMSRHNHGDGVVKDIADQIQPGAMVFMHREYKMLSVFALVLLVAIFVSPLGMNSAIAFVAGTLSSATAGYLGMFAATKANVRNAVAAHGHGQEMVLSIAFYGVGIAAVGMLATVGITIGHRCVRTRDEQRWSIHEHPYQRDGDCQPGDCPLAVVK